MKYILPFLWGAHHGLIETVHTSPQVSSQVTKKTNEIHKESIKNQEEVTKKVNFEDLTGPPQVMEQMNARLDQLVSNYIMNQWASISATKKKFENHPNPLFRNLLLHVLRNMEAVFQANHLII